MIAFATAPILAWERGDLLPGNEVGTVAVRWPKDSNTVLSVQPNGTYQTRPDIAIGSWESAKKIGDKLVYRVEDKVFVVPLIEGL